MKNHNLALNPGIGSGSNPRRPQRQHERHQPRPRGHDGGLLHGQPHVSAERGGERRAGDHRRLCRQLGHRPPGGLRPGGPDVRRAGAGEDPPGHRQRRRLSQGPELLPDHQDPLQRPGGGGRRRHPDPGDQVGGGLRQRGHPAADRRLCHHGGAGEGPAGELLHRRLHRLPLCRERREVPHDRRHRHGPGGLRHRQDPRGQDPGRGAGAVPPSSTAAGTCGPRCCPTAPTPCPSSSECALLADREARPLPGPRSFRQRDRLSSAGRSSPRSPGPGGPS